MPLRSPRSTRRRSRASQLEGITNWTRTLDRHVWLLRRAGIPQASILRQVTTSLGKHRDTRSLAIPSVPAVTYSRVLTHWQNESKYLDETSGAPRPLRLQGRGLSFYSLVRESLPDVSPAEVFKVLARHRLISHRSNGEVKMMANAFVPRGRQRARAQFLGIVLAAIEALVDTCYVNLRMHQPAKSIGRLQQSAMAENFDVRYLAEYDKFLRKSSIPFLSMHDAWLKRHEVKPRRGRRRGRLVGVSLFGFRP